MGIEDSREVNMANNKKVSHDDFYFSEVEARRNRPQCQCDKCCNERRWSWFNPAPKSTTDWS